MVRTYRAVCARCDHHFGISEGSDKRSHILHCVRCGRDKRIGLKEIREYYNRYLRTFLTARVPEKQVPFDESVRPLLSDNQLNTKKYAFMVEHLAGQCICGAGFRFSGKPRCPRCRSTAIRREPKGTGGPALMQPVPGTPPKNHA
jgi:hypothetical protein